MRVHTCVALVAFGLAGGCSDLGDDPFPNAIDSGIADARADARIPDAATMDAGVADGGGPTDAVPADARGSDGAPADASAPDAVDPDANELDATAASDKFEAMPSFTRHLFICVNERAPGNPKGCCMEKGAGEVRDTFKKRLAEAGLHGLVRANKAGCLDQCAAGTAVVVYPEQVWYGAVTADDVQEIIDSHIIGGTFVTRLMLPDQAHLDGATSGPPMVVPPRSSDDDTA